MWSKCLHAGALNLDLRLVVPQVTCEENSQEEVDFNGDNKVHPNFSGMLMVENIIWKQKRETSTTMRSALGVIQDLEQRISKPGREKDRNQSS